MSEADFESGTYSDSAAYADAKAAYAERLKRVATGVFPGLSDAIVFEEVATPLTHTRYTLSTGGTSYGLALIPGQFLHRRPGAKTEIEGLLLCGASTRMGHGIMGAMMSGVAAAAALVGGSVFREALGPQPRGAAGGAEGAGRQCGSAASRVSTRLPFAITVRTGL